MPPKAKSRNAKDVESDVEATPIDARWRLTGWLAMAGLWLIVMASVVSYNAADAPSAVRGVVNDPPANWVGRFGASVAHEGYLMLGPGLWVLLAGWTILLLAAMRRRVIDQIAIRGIGLAVVAIASAGLLALSVPSVVTGLGITTSVGPGGLLPTFLLDQLGNRFAGLGTFVILALFLMVGLVVTADTLVLNAGRHVIAAFERLTDLQMPKLAVSLPSMPSLNWSSAVETPAAPPKRRRTTRKPASRKAAPPPKRGRRGAATHIDEDAGGLGGTETFDPAALETDEDEVIYEYVDEDGNPIDPSDLDAYETLDEESELEEDEYEYEEDEVEDGAAEEAEWEDEDEEIEEDEGAPAAYLAEKRQFTPEELREKIRKLPINYAGKSDAGITDANLPREIDLSGYEFPSLDLLAEPDDDNSDTRLELVQEQGYVLESAMTEYRIKGEVVGIDSGPSITLYEVRLAPGTKVASLERVSTDLARSLKAQNIRIVPNMAGKDTVGVEVPNIERERVSMRELMAVSAENSQKMALPMWLGKDASGNPLVYDLNTMPHMLIAGTTGSGKSVCMNAIIMSLLFTKRPDELKLVLVDPKMVEMAMYKDIPHLMCPVVTEMSKAAAILEWAVTKMDERYELLAEAGVRNIQGYNDLEIEELKDRLSPASDEEWARIPKKLPYIVFVIDELADLMMTNKEVETHIVRIAQKARAVGLHLILATQRPQANVVTGLIKGNMPCRVSFRVASKLDSRIVLDTGGAELLMGHGDMLFLNPKTSKISRCQGSFIEDSEIRRTVKFLKTVAGPSFEPALVQLKGSMLDGEQERDELFNDAVETVLETQRGSVSLLQRKLTIGYSRASRMIEQMEAAGVLGGHKTAQAREVLISKDEWEAIKHQMAADAEITVAGADPEDEFDDDPGDDSMEASDLTVRDGVEEELAVDDDQIVDEDDEGDADEAEGEDAEYEDEDEEEEEDEEEAEYEEGEYEEGEEGEEGEEEEEDEDDAEYEEDEYEEDGEEEEAEEEEEVETA